MKRVAKGVLVVMGSASDMEVMRKASDFLEGQGIRVETVVASAHRTPEKVTALCKRVEAEFDVVIAGAGVAAHLPGVVAAQVSKPVIGVPVQSGALQGFDALLAIVQMPPGLPVATVAINGGKNAGILAMQMIALFDEEVAQKYETFRAEMRG